MSKLVRELAAAVFLLWGIACAMTGYNLGYHNAVDDIKNGDLIVPQVYMERPDE